MVQVGRLEEKNKNIVSNLGNDQEAEKDATQQEERQKGKLEGAAQEAVLPKDPHEPIDNGISDDGFTKLSKMQALKIKNQNQN